MPKIVMPISALAVCKLKAVGWHAVGGVGGLNLQIREFQNKNFVCPMPKSWVLRTHISSKRVPLGLGSYPQASLAEAREAAKCHPDLSISLNSLRLAHIFRLFRRRCKQIFQMWTWPNNKENLIGKH